MFRDGQMVNTKYGAGVVICVSRFKPLIYVRLLSRSGGIYMLDEIGVTAIEPQE